MPLYWIDRRDACLGCDVRGRGEMSGAFVPSRSATCLTAGSRRRNARRVRRRSRTCARGTRASKMAPAQSRRDALDELSGDRRVEPFAPHCVPSRGPQATATNPRPVATDALRRPTEAGVGQNVS